MELAEDWMGCNGYTMKAQWAAQVRPIRNNEKNEKITRIDMLQEIMNRADTPSEVSIGYTY